jgi:hypothetical protein
MGYAKGTFASLARALRSWDALSGFGQFHDATHRAFFILRAVNPMTRAPEVCFLLPLCSVKVKAYGISKGEP